MNKQLITIIGALATAVVLVLAVLFGVAPLVSSGFAAMTQTAQEASVNQGYRAQVDELEQEEKRMAEIEDSVSDLRAQIPSDPLLDQPFGIIADAAQSNDLSVESITRGDLAVFAPRAAPSVSGPATNAAAGTAPTSPAEGPASPVDAAQDAAAGADEQTEATNAGSGASAPAAAAPTQAAPTPSAASGISMNGSLTGQLQIPIEVTATATDMADVIAFLDGLRGRGRVIAVDKVVVSGSAGELAVTVSAFVFVSTQGASR
ncbi:hypothetical protein FVO59_04390 [Microbacterium esteraromaticum]|uniref:Type IV pilus biogenesis protein PilO n=1 Tax=Microbacterium esteraromaticum TaxID=57043 RepID=A0A7D7WHJ2_9MICO|nr:hypothetical protein [Microbacterium esteraromaticum]QMU96530.1 hypothetical protein FVO59_04390 [Microbacterium esteraromaticum]